MQVHLDGCCRRTHQACYLSYGEVGLVEEEYGGALVRRQRAECLKKFGHVRGFITCLVLQLDQRASPPKLCCSDPEGCSIQPGLRLTDHAVVLDRSGECLRDRVVSHVAPPSGVCVDGSPQGKAGGSIQRRVVAFARQHANTSVWDAERLTTCLCAEVDRLRGSSTARRAKVSLGVGRVRWYCHAVEPSPGRSCVKAAGFGSACDAVAARWLASVVREPLPMLPFTTVEASRECLVLHGRDVEDLPAVQTAVRCRCLIDAHRMCGTAVRARIVVDEVSWLARHQLHPLPLPPAERTDRIVDGYQLRPPWAVGTASRFSSTAIAASVRPCFRRRRILLHTGSGN